MLVFRTRKIKNKYKKVQQKLEVLKNRGYRASLKRNLHLTAEPSLIKKYMIEDFNNFNEFSVNFFNTQRLNHNFIKGTSSLLQSELKLFILKILKFFMFKDSIPVKTYYFYGSFIFFIPNDLIQIFYMSIKKIYSYINPEDIFKFDFILNYKVLFIVFYSNLIDLFHVMFNDILNNKIPLFINVIFVGYCFGHKIVYQNDFLNTTPELFDFFTEFQEIEKSSFDSMVVDEVSDPKNDGLVSIDKILDPLTQERDILLLNHSYYLFEKTKLNNLNISLYKQPPSFRKELFIPTFTPTDYKKLTNNILSISLQFLKLLYYNDNT